MLGTSVPLFGPATDRMLVLFHSTQIKQKKGLRRMKRLLYAAAVFASLTMTSTIAVAGKHDDEKVLMCHRPGRKDQKEVLVNVKDIAKKLAEGDRLGSCYQEAEPE